MTSYNFKEIAPIPEAGQLVDIVLSKTNRKTPTVVHPNFKITRIRNFYMRKVKFCHQEILERITGIIESFPKLDDLHPFYADLLNVLYDKDHYKIALGQLNNVNKIVENISKDYLKLMKYAESAYRCKMLKRAALGRMATTLKKLKASLQFLEEVRKHIGRLPSIDPFTRTLLLCGFPNVGKSSFINNISNANTEVQPYAFTTKALHVGHTDYNHVKWQCIDSPGLLDSELETRNTIEMQSITALAHLKACVLYLLDISETCGYTIVQQINLFKGIKPLFENKPHILVLTKIDLKPYDQLDQEDRKTLEAFVAENNLTVVQLSNMEEGPIYNVKKTACDLLLNYRLKNEDKNVRKNPNLKREEDFLRGVTVFKPTKTRDSKSRPAYVPPTLSKNDNDSEPQMTLKEMEEKYGGAGVFTFPAEEKYMLDCDDWKYDNPPDIMDGKNILDFYDPEIEEKLAILEAEEDRLLEEMNLGMVDDEFEPREDYLEAKKEILKKTSEYRMERVLKKPNKVNQKYAELADLKEQLGRKSKDPSKVASRFAGNDLKPRVMKRILGINADGSTNDITQNDGMMDLEDDTDALEKRTRSKIRSATRNRTISQKRDLTPMEEASKKLKRLYDKNLIHLGKASQLDNKVYDLKPKHLNSGKRGLGTADRR